MKKARAQPLDPASCEGTRARGGSAPGPPILAGFLLAAVFIAATLIGSAHVDDWLFRVAMLMMLATSWNLMAGAGLISLGHAAFWGVGSYAGMLAANAWSLPFLGTMLVSAVAGAVLGVFLALTTGRLRGVFFAICTLALAEGLRVSALMLPGITGGAVGTYLRHDMTPPTQTVFLAGTGAAVLGVAIAAWLTATPFHYYCRALRSHEGAAQMLGIDPRRVRLMVLALSGAIASCAGGINAMYGGYIDPTIAFSLQITIQAQIAPIIGGMYTVGGAVAGAVAITELSDLTRSVFGQREGFSQLTFGLLLGGCVLFMPRGLHGVWRRVVAALEHHRAGLAATNAAKAGE